MVSGKSGKEICTSGQCRFSTDGTNLPLIPPNAQNMGLYYDIDFKLQDNITNANLGPKKKEFIKQFISKLLSTFGFKLV